MHEKEEAVAFLTWATEIGVSDSPPESPERPSCLGHSLFLSDFPAAGGRGLAAARELDRGEMVLRVPRAALLTRENVLMKDGKLASCFRKHANLSSTQLLTVCLLAEVGKGRCSWWYPYLLQLPRYYDTLANFKQFEIQAFQVDDAIWVSEKAVCKVQSDWKEAIILMKDIELCPKFITFGAWLWASSTVSSRALHVPWDSAGCLCPVGDFFNYAAPEDGYCCKDVDKGTSLSHCSQLPGWKDHDKKTDQHDSSSWRLTDGGYEENIDSYCFYARNRYSKGDQVLLSYGTYTNLELLEHYGFILTDNPNEKVFIQLNTEIKSCSTWPRESLYIQQDGRPSFALIALLRLEATPKNLRRAVGHLAYSGSQLSVENETSVMQFVAKQCQDKAGQLPTSLEDDGMLLDAIDGMLTDSRIETALPSCSVDELRTFLQENGLSEDDAIAIHPIPFKIKRSLERWRLAVCWRIIYKETLFKCISYCHRVIETVS